MNDGKQMIEGAADPFVAWHVGDKDRCPLLMRVISGLARRASSKTRVSYSMSPANLAGAPGAFRALHAVRVAIRGWVIPSCVVFLLSVILDL